MDNGEELYRCKECGREGISRGGMFCPGKRVSKWCRECWSIKRKDRTGRYAVSRVIGRTPDDLMRRELEEVREIVQVMVEQPNITMVGIARVLGIKVEVVKYHMKRNDYLKAMVYIATKRVKQLIPKALKALDDSLERGGSEEVRAKVAVKVLENEGVLGPQRLDLQVNDLSHLSERQLRERIEMAKEIPKQTMTLDGELVE